jgi:hypothetical protein
MIGELLMLAIRKVGLTSGISNSRLIKRLPGSISWDAFSHKVSIAAGDK